MSLFADKDSTKNAVSRLLFQKNNLKTAFISPLSFMRIRNPCFQPLILLFRTKAGVPEELSLQSFRSLELLTRIVYPYTFWQHHFARVFLGQYRGNQISVTQHELILAINESLVRKRIFHMPDDRLTGLCA